MGAGVRKVTSDDELEWYRRGTQELRLADAIGEADGAAMTVGFARYAAGEANDWTMSYDEALIVTKGRFAVDGPDGTVEAAEVRAGDPCPACGAGRLAPRRGVEVGRLRRVGRRYADAFGLTALGPDGARVPVTTGSYHLDLTRLLAVVVEQHHDERGLVWPAPLAPCDAHLVPTGAAQLPAAVDLAEELVGRGLRVLLDDRSGVSAGVKFTDAELIGIPTTVVLGRRLAEGYVEVRTRATGQRADVPLAEAPERVGSAPAGGAE